MLGMSGKASPSTLARVALLIGPVAFLVMVSYVIIARVAYPFQLEWMEGGSLQHMLRVRAGLPIYGPPSLGFTAYQYPPLYYYVAALVAKIPGMAGFLPMRLTSVLASLGCVASIFLIIRKQTSSPYWGLIGAGLFVATFRQGGAWFDIARVDMLFVFLLLAAQVALLHCRAGNIWAGVLLGLAFYTKQTALLVALPMVAVVVWRGGWRAGLQMTLLFAVVAAGTTAIEQWRSGGWYAYYVFGLPRQHGLAKPILEQLAFRSAKLLEPVSLAAVLAIAYAIRGRREAWKRGAEATSVFVLALVALGLGARLTHGCYDNVSIPFFAGLSVAVGLAGRWLEGLILSETGRVAMLLACAAQFLILNFDIQKQIPTEGDRKAGEALVQQLKRIDGDILIPAHGYLALAAGKVAFAHEIALLEVHGGFTKGGFDSNLEFDASLRSDVAARRFSAVILDGKHQMWQPVLDAYESNPMTYPDDRTFTPVTGMPTRPTVLCTPP
jgi:hypothetical protein